MHFSRLSNTPLLHLWMTDAKFDNYHCQRGSAHNGVMSEIMGKEESLRLFLLLLAAAVATAFSSFCSLFLLLFLCILAQMASKLASKEESTKRDIWNRRKGRIPAVVPGAGSSFCFVVLILVRIASVLVYFGRHGCHTSWIAFLPMFEIILETFRIRKTAWLCCCFELGCVYLSETAGKLIFIYLSLLWVRLRR